MQADQTDLLRLIARHMSENPHKWERARGILFSLKCEELNMGIATTFGGRGYRLFVNDADRQGQTQVDFGGKDSPIPEDVARALEAAIEPFRQTATREATSSALDRLRRALGKDDEILAQSAERLVAATEPKH